MRTVAQWYGFIQTLLKAGVNVGMHNIDLHNSPSEWVNITEKYLSAILNRDAQYWFVQQPVNNKEK